MITKRTVLNEAQLELLDLVSVMDSKEEIENFPLRIFIFFLKGKCFFP